MTTRRATSLKRTRAARENRAAFGLNLRRARKEAGLTHAAVHERTGLAMSFISDVELGKSNISLDTMCILADLLGTTVECLVKGVSAPATK